MKKPIGLSAADVEKSPEDELEDRMARRAGPPKRGRGRPAAPPYELSPAKERDQRAMGRRARMTPPMDMPPNEDFD